MRFAADGRKERRWGAWNAAIEGIPAYRRGDTHTTPKGTEAWVLCEASGWEPERAEEF